MSLLFWIADRWFFLLPLLLGFIATWELLPKARRSQTLLAMAVGLGSTVVAGFLLPRFTGSDVPLTFDILFCLFSGLAILSGAAMIVQRNPVFAALWFALVILAASGLFLLQSAPFLAVAAITVYAGAIIVTFMFVIMLAQQTGQAEYDRRSREPFLASLAGFLLMGGLLYAIDITYRAPSRLPDLVARLELAISKFGAGEFDRGEAALQLPPPWTLELALVEEARRLPAWQGMPELAQRVGVQGRLLAQAQARRDGTGMQAACQGLLALATEIQGARDRHLGQMAVPPEIIRQTSPLSNRQPGVSYSTGLGRALFGDYLYAVEIAGTLLLAATIGAIVITQRRRRLAA